MMKGMTMNYSAKNLNL